MTLRHGSLFSGIGGFDLAAEWCGWKNVFHCEWKEFGQKVLKHYWPEAESYGDITKTDFTKWRGSIDIISGGFPCQPYSSAGKRLGKEDERHLWPEMLRAIREAAPSFVVGENVRGLTNWNGGLVFDEVQTDLENLGYQVAAFLIPAAGVNAPHGRDRIWFVAKDTSRDGRLQRELEQERAEIREQRNACTRSSERIHLPKGNATNTKSSNDAKLSEPYQSRKNRQPSNNGRARNVADTDGGRTQTRQNGKVLAKSDRKRKTRGFINAYSQANWEQFPTESPICGGDDGIPTELDGITFSKWRNESIKAYGNAIVPQVAYQIFKTIEQTKYENY